MEVWEDVQDLTNLNYQGRIIEYPDFRGDTYDGLLIPINGDECT